MTQMIFDGVHGKLSVNVPGSLVNYDSDMAASNDDQRSSTDQARLYFDATGISTPKELGAAYFDLVVSSVSESHAEIYQLAQSNSSKYLMTAYGDSPVQISIQAILYRNMTDLWDREFRIKYFQKRASKGTKVAFYWANTRAYGWLVSMNRSISAGNEMVSNVGFSLLLSEYKVMGKSIEAKEEKSSKGAVEKEVKAVIQEDSTEALLALLTDDDDVTEGYPMSDGWTDPEEIYAKTSNPKSPYRKQAVATWKENKKGT